MSAGNVGTGESTVIHPDKAIICSWGKKKAEFCTDNGDISKVSVYFIIENEIYRTYRIGLSR